jgi:hypothetical protein
VGGLTVNSESIFQGDVTANAIIDAFGSISLQGTNLEVIGGTSTNTGATGWNGEIDLPGGTSFTVQHGLIIAVNGFTGTNDSIGTEGADEGEGENEGEGEGENEENEEDGY